MGKQEEDERGTTSISVRLDDTLIKWLEQQAEEHNRTRSNMIETILKQVRHMAAAAPVEEPKDVLAILRKPLKQK